MIGYTNDNPGDGVNVSAAIVSAYNRAVMHTEAFIAHHVESFKTEGVPADHIVVELEGDADDYTARVSVNPEWFA